MKRGPDPFRLVPIIDLPDERVSCLACGGDHYYIGTYSGGLLQYNLPSGAAEELATSSRLVGMVRLTQKKPVEQVLFSHGYVFALADGMLYLLSNDDIQASNTPVLVREVKCFALHTGGGSGPDDPVGPEICLCMKNKKVLFYGYNGQSRAMEQRQEFLTAEVALTAVWHQTWVCIGFAKKYIVYRDRQGVPRELCTTDGKFPPQVVVLSGSEMLVMVQENSGRFYTLGNQMAEPQASSKNVLTWPRKVFHLAVSGSYVLGTTGAGQVDVFSARDQRNVQTLTLEGPSVSMCTSVQGRVLAASEHSISCLDPIAFERQVQKLLMQVRVADALELLNSSFGPEDPARYEQLGKFHALAGWALFKDLQFALAFQHFLYAPDLRVGRLLAFWRRYLPAGWESSFSGRSADDGSPEPCDIADFVKAQLQDKHFSEALASAVSANVNIASAAFAKFLLRQREAFLAEERTVHPHGAAAAEIEAQLRAVDTVLIKLLIETETDQVDLKPVLEAGVRCAVEDCESFLRERQRVDVLARLWKASGLFGLVLEEWSKLLDTAPASSDTLRSGQSPPTKAQVVSEIADTLRMASCSEEGPDLLRQYVPVLLQAEPKSVLQVFAGASRPGRLEVCAMPVDDILTLLEDHDDLVLGYLEHLVAHKREMLPHHWGLLASIYVAKVEEELRAPPGNMPVSSTRQKLLRFFEAAASLDAQQLLEQIRPLKLYEESVVLHVRLQQHREALQVLVEKLNDLPRAEAYSRIVTASRHFGTSTREVPVDEVSVFSTDIPGWVWGPAFGGKKASSSTSLSPEDEASALAVLGKGPSPDVPVVQRPLMLLCSVLLEAHAGALERPEDYRKVAAEYREAVFALLLAYAGHRDMAPPDVLGLLPSSWSIQSLAGYLKKSVRICLHNKRRSMLEENLSSMAYLKTFEAWAEERKKKVNITMDKCCPVCTRRFVDKTSVGKAFVAYPNGTCVHLQCKDDPSVCPKTGTNFADNYSVFCHALGSSKVEVEE